MLELMLATSDPVNRQKLKALSGGSSGSATAVMCLTDFHAEENVRPEYVDGMNEFNPEIAERRLNRTFQKMIQMLEFSSHLSNIKDIVVWLGGDLINNQLHEEATESNFKLPTDAINWIQERIMSGLDFILDETKMNVTVVTNYGNHGRTTRKRHISSGHGHSWEFLAYNSMSHAYRKDPRIAFKVEQGYHNWLTIQGHDIRFHHGDAVKFGGGVGGVAVPLKKKIAQWNKVRTAHLDVLGHFHQFEHNWKYVLCGCLVGWNAYALEIGAEYQPPTQTFIVIDRNRGKVLAEPVFCEGNDFEVSNLRTQQSGQGTGIALAV